MELVPSTRAEALLSTPRLRLCAPSPEMAPATTAYAQRNREHFAPWDPPIDEASYTESWQRQWLTEGARAFAAGHAYRYWLQPTDDASQVIGSMHFSGITRGPMQGCTLGYGLDAARVGQGLMSEALAAGIAEMFSARVNLHRIQASFRPENERSERVLRVLGFRIEGLAPDYLYIDGDWRAHRIAALLNPDFIRPDAWG